MDDMTAETCRSHADRIRRPFGRCLHASERLVEGLRRQGVEAEVVRCSKGRFSAPDADPRWLRLRGGSGSWVHYVVRIGQECVDLTRRQFFPADPHPFITDMEGLARDWDVLEPVVPDMKEARS